MAASEKKLNALHEKLTDIFLDILDCEEVETGMEIPSATLKTISSFLKDNSITCQDDETIGNLRDRLNRKKKLTMVSPINPDVEDGFKEAYGR